MRQRYLTDRLLVSLLLFLFGVGVTSSVWAQGNSLSDALSAPFTFWRNLSEGFLNHWHQYLYAFLTLFFVFVFRRFMIHFVMKRLFKYANASNTDMDNLTLDAIESPLNFGLNLLGLWGATLFLGSEVSGASPVITGDAALIIHKLISLMWFIILGWVGLNFCDVLSHFLSQMAGQTKTRMDDMLIPIFRRSLKIFVTLVTLILLIQNWGYSISALLAGFSIGGVAIALASQDMLQNLFGSLMIFIDRPFQVGDWISVGSIEGVVEEVGLRSTRVRTFSETLITVPNHKIAHEPINNYSRMPKRRVKQEVGIGYDTEPKRIEASIQAIRAILRDHPEVDQTFWMVNFNHFGDSSINLLVYYFTKTTNWVSFMEVKQEISLDIMRALSTLGVEIAFPTRTVYLREDELSEKPPLEDVVHIYSPESESPPAPTESGESGDG